MTGLALLLCTGVVVSGQQPSVLLDGSSKGRVFDGLGGVSAGASSRLLIDYPEPQRSQILDYLFKPGYGAALQHLKVEIGADVNSTDGSEPSHMRTASDHNSSRGYEWWLMAEAHKRNPHVILEVLPWGAPKWVGSNSGGKETLYSSKMADYVADFIRTAKRDYSLDIAYAGIWNETAYDVAYIKELRSNFKAHHLSTRIICCDGNPGDQWTIAPEILKDPDLATAIDVIGVHYPFWFGPTTTDAARRTNKPLWSSEDQPNRGSGPFVSRDWHVGGRILAHLYNKNYLEGSLTATEIWSPVTSYYDILAAPNSGLMYANTPWSGHYDVQGTIWATAHTTQFAQPGWQYLDSSSGNLPEKGTYVALRSPDAKDWSVILETIDAKHPQTVSFRPAGGLAANEVHIWETNDSRTFEHVADVKPVNGTLTYTFDPDSLYSLTTTTGQGKGSVKPPAAKPFPFPYGDDFEKTQLGHSAKYLADQDGAFEVRDCNGRSGRCLEQVITDKAIPWGALPDPITLAGDENWTDYRVAADVRFLSESPAVVIGRIDASAADDKTRLPGGYVLRVKPDGIWEILSVEYKKPAVTLASGSIAIDRNQWHRLELSFNGTQIAAALDGKLLATAESSVHSHGMFALGTEWGHIQFDNLRVTAVEAQSANTLTPAEVRDGWKLLFDGHSTKGWRGAYMQTFPSKGWDVSDGELRGVLSGGMEAGDAGDIVTLNKYTSFDLVFDWKLGLGGNSGVKYFVEERQPKPAGSQPGYEYQIIDDANYIYRGEHLPPRLKTASIYDVVPANLKGDTQMGVWHHSRVLVRGDHIQHWLDGIEVLDVDRKFARFKQGVAESKFNGYPGFASIPSGYILLQDHGHNVAFKNIKIKELP